MTTAVDAARTHPPHTRTAVFGLLLVSAAVAIGVTTDLASGVPPTELHPALPALLFIPAFIAWLAWRFGTWSKVLAAVIGPVLVLANIPFLVEALPRLASPLEFMAAVTYLTGGVLAAIGGAVAAVGRDRVVDEATPAARWIQLGTLFGLGALAGISVVISATTTGTVDDDLRGDAIEVPVVAHEFGDGTIEVPAGEPTTLLVHNRDAGYHTFTIEELGIDVELLPGDEVAVELPALEAGDHRVICVPHPEMVATLVVR